MATPICSNPQISLLKKWLSSIKYHVSIPLKKQFWFLQTGLYRLTMQKVCASVSVGVMSVFYSSQHPTEKWREPNCWCRGFSTALLDVSIFCLQSMVLLTLLRPKIKTKHAWGHSHSSEHIQLWYWYNFKIRHFRIILTWTLEMHH